MFGGKSICTLFKNNEDGLKTVKFSHQIGIGVLQKWCANNRTSQSINCLQLLQQRLQEIPSFLCHVWSATLHCPNSERYLKQVLYIKLYKTYYILHCLHSNPGPQRLAKGAAQSTNCTSWAYIRRWMCRKATAILSSILAFGASRHSDTCQTSTISPTKQD